MDFQTRLTNIRRSKGFTQKQVADGIGISEVGLQNYENARRKPAFDVLIALADFYDVSLDYLVGRSNNPARH